MEHFACLNSGKLDKLFKSPLTLWSSAHSKFTKHQNDCKMHARSSLDLADFITNVNTGKPAINVKLNNNLNDRTNAVISCYAVHFVECDTGTVGGGNTG